MKKYSFDFRLGYQGWEPGFADYRADSVDSYQLVAELRNLPAAAGSGQSLFISGMNHSDDLFMFHRRRISGLAPGQTYEVSIRVALASKYVSETGIGGDPAKSVYLKGCAATHEPVQIADGDLIRLNIDIGDQANAGTNSVVLGDIEKKRDGSQSYVMIERASVKPLKCAADAQGQMWLLFGTDSGYEGETSLYYSQFEAVIT